MRLLIGPSTATELVLPDDGQPVGDPLDDDPLVVTGAEAVGPGRPLEHEVAPA